MAERTGDRAAKEKRDEATRQRILLRAVAVLSMRGFGAMTMDEIAQGLGMSKKTLYQHFASKEDLAREALEEGFRDAERALVAARSGDNRSFADRLRSHVLVVIERHGQLNAPMLEELERSQPALYARYQELMSSTIERNLGALLAAGVKAGEIRADLDPRFVVRAVQALSGELLKPARLSELGLSPAEAAEKMLKLVLEGIRTRKPENSRQR